LLLRHSASCPALLSLLAVRHQNKNFMATWETCESEQFATRDRAWWTAFAC
jgi:hypothetical protein